MKNKFQKLLFLVLLSTFALSCSNDDHHDDHSDDTSQEYKYVRVLISDEKTTELSLVNPVDATTSFFNTKFPKSALYTTESGREKSTGTF